MLHIGTIGTNILIFRFNFFYFFYTIYILFLDDLIPPSSEENTRGNVFQQSTTLTAKMWPPVCFIRLFNFVKKEINQNIFC